MNRREFAGICGGGMLGAAFLKLGWKTPPRNPATAKDDHSGEQLVVTAVINEGRGYDQTYTWVITNPVPGATFAGPIMKYPGTMTGLSFYSTRGDYLGHVDVGPRVINSGDTLSLAL